MIDLDFGALAPFIAAIFSGLAAFFYGYRKANTNRDVKDAKAYADGVIKSKEVRDDIDSLDDSGLAKRASKWLRSKK